MLKRRSLLAGATALTTLPLNSLVVYNSYLAKMMAIDGVSLTNGVINILTTAAANRVCVEGRDATHYLTTDFSGTWTAS